MESLQKQISDDEILKLFFKYKQSSFNNTICSNDTIFKFKENIQNYEKIFSEIANHTYRQKMPNQIDIYVKESKETKVYQENPSTQPQPQSENPSDTNTQKSDENQNQPSEKQRSFLMIGGYPDIADSLIKRGWKQITDPEDTSFDYIYTLKACDCHFDTLLPEQMAGHFWKSRAITRKVELIKNLRNLYYKGVCVDNFYPRAYMLADRNDLEDFLEDFKTNKALCILKLCVENKGKNCNKEMVDTAIDIIKRKILFLNGKMNIKETVDSVKTKTYKENKKCKNEFNFDLITDKEWEIIGEEDMNVYHEYINRLKRQKILSSEKDEHLFKNIKIERKSNKKGNLNIKEENKEHNDEKDDEEDDEKEEKDEIHEKEAHKPIPKMTTHQRPPPKPKIDNLSDKVEEIQSLLYQIKLNMPQYTMDGTNNIWICKPGGLSRGRGIYCIDQINDILSNIKIRGQTIVQKYIENPLIILGRKFDIRQWVLVTSLSPLTVWMFDTPYLRFGAEDYNLTDFKNIFSHLTNNSIAKYSEHFGDTKIEGDMWETETFRQYLVDNYGKDYWPEIQEKIKKIIIYSLESAKHKIFHKEKWHEVFGYDIMIDEKLNVYLIEINASPDWTYSTKVTEKLVKIMSDDIIKVVVDYADNEKKDKKEVVDTGKLKLVFNSDNFPSFDNMNVNFKEISHI